MNILFILKQFPRYGGVEKMTITLSNSLVKKDIMSVYYLFLKEINVNI